MGKATYLAGLLILFIAAPSFAQGTSTVTSGGSFTAYSWDWSGSGDWFTSSNWNFGAGPIEFAPNNQTLPVYFGPEEYILDGAFVSYLSPTGAATLSSDYSSPTLTMVTGIDTSLTINNNTIYTTNATVGNAPTNGANGSSGTPTLSLDSGNIYGSVTVGGNSRGILTISGNSSVQSLTVASGSSSAGTINITGGSLTVANGTSLGSGNSTLINRGVLSLGNASGTVSSLSNLTNGSVFFLGNLEISGAVTNQGTINISATSSTGRTYLSTNVTTTLTGGGTITLTDPTYSYLYPNGGTFTNTDNTIHGTGNIEAGASIINNGTVNADISGQKLSLQTGYSGTIANAGTMTASNGGILSINASINNAGGTVSAQAGSTVTINSGGINGGTLSGAGTVTFGSGILTGVANSAAITVPGGNFGYLAGAISNTGSFTITGSGSTSNAYLSTNVTTTLSGGGTITLTDPTYSYLYPNGGTFTNTDNTIHGTGNIEAGASIINNGTVNADISGQKLSLQTGYSGTIANAGTMTASNGGILSINASINNAGGTVSAQAGSTVTINSGGINGGTLSGAGTVTFGSGILTGVANSAAITVPGGNFGYLAGAISNTGSFTITGSGSTSNAYLSTNVTTTLSGGGTITLTDPTYSYLYPNGGTFTNTDNTIHGTGNIEAGASIINNGTVNADISGQKLSLQTGYSGTIANAGTMTASNGGILSINASINNAGGTVSAQAGSTVTINSGGINGGTLSGAGTVTGSVKLLGTTISPGDSKNAPATLSILSGTTDFASGGVYLWETNSLPGATPLTRAGTNFDLLNLNQVTISATAAQPFTIKLISLTSANLPGTLNGFTPGQTYTWAIAKFDVLNGSFSAADFSLDLSSFPGAMGARLTADTIDDYLEVTVVPEPTFILNAFPIVCIAIYVRPRKKLTRRSI